MKPYKIPTLVLLPEEELEAIKTTLARLDSHLSQVVNRPAPMPAKEWLTRIEAMHALGVKSTKFHHLVTSGILKIRKKKRRLYVHLSSIEDYFNNK